MSTHAYYMDKDGKWLGFARINLLGRSVTLEDDTHCAETVAGVRGTTNCRPQQWRGGVPVYYGVLILLSFGFIAWWVWMFVA